MWDNISVVHLGYGILLSLPISWLAYWKGALTISGAITAFGMGTLIFGIGGWGWAILLITFFLTSSILSRLFLRRKQSLASQNEKGARRDWVQVLANGGIATGCVLLQGLFPHSGMPFLAASASLAAANADTWATEIGVLSLKPPRLITNGRVVERGTSGGVSMLGWLAACAGSLLIALVGLSFIQSKFPYFVIVWLSGMAGSLLDSLLGASVQVIYHCPRCNQNTEKHPLHSCGEKTLYSQGWAWLNNDGVNLACTGVAALIAIGLASL